MEKNIGGGTTPKWKLIAAAALLLFVPSKIIAQEKQSAQTELEEARQLHQQVEKLFAERKIDAAVTAAQRALAIREKELPPDDADVAESLNDLGVLYQQKGELEQSLSLLQRALAIREKSLAPASPLLIETLPTLALVYQARADFSNAEPLINRVLTA